MYRAISFLALVCTASLFGIVLNAFLPPQSGWWAHASMWGLAGILAELTVTFVAKPDMK